ncbi:hypothetical protein [Micromonospora sp. NPDC050276]|uniref:hypothetical protein n=1 Tax=Micromonospora sp. NPDC050276 TaxID=3364278 RepID=UPI00379E0037
MPLGHRADSRPQASAGVVMAAPAAYLPLRSRPAMPCPAPNSDQSWPLAAGRRAVSNGQQKAITSVHLRGLDGMCSGCRTWWARLTPYPCWQVEWATSRQARTITARFLANVR